LHDATRLFYEQFDELFKERHSIRNFRREKIDRSLLVEIAQHSVLASMHAFNLRVIIVDDEDLINRLDQAIAANCRWIYIGNNKTALSKASSQYVLAKRNQFNFWRSRKIYFEKIVYVTIYTEPRTILAQKELPLYI